MERFWIEEAVDKKVCKPEVLSQRFPGLVCLPGLDAVSVAIVALHIIADG